MPPQEGASHTAVANKAEGVIGSRSVGTAHHADDDDPFAAVLVMCDPYEWFEALQVSTPPLASLPTSNHEPTYPVSVQ